MGEFAKVNLREVEDAAPRFGVQGLEARFPKSELGSTIGAVSLQRLAPGVRQPFGHRQRVQEELYVILAGSGRMKLDDEVIDVRELDAIRVSPGTMRAFEAGPDGLELLAYGAPLSAENDAELVQGWWSE